VRRGAGFTLVEILIPIVVLAVGLLGVLALLTGALRTSGGAVESTFAASLARSVYESLREGARRRAFMVEDGNLLIRGFVFVHEGVKDRNDLPPPTLEDIPTTWGPEEKPKLDALRRSDFVIFLPVKPTAGNEEPYFVFPRPGGAEADNAYKGEGRDNWLSTRLDVRAVYRLRDTRPPPSEPRPEASDQYGFAIAVRRAMAPRLTNAGEPLPWFNTTDPFAANTGVYPPGFYPPGGANPAVARDGLYQVEVLVYRNFDPEADVESRHHQPVTTFLGLVAVGP
jgi:type II secretory pathway pseudopilin PulG